MPVVTLRPIDRGAEQAPPTLRVLVRRGEHTLDGPGWATPEEDRTLIPQRMTWGHSGALSTLTLASELGRGPERAERLRPELAVTEAAEGDEVILVQDIGGESVERFRGIVGQESILVQSNPDVEARTLTAYGPEIRLAAIAVHGQWHKTTAVDDKYIVETATASDLTEANVWAAGLPVVFNMDGKPNCSQATSRMGTDWSWTLNGIANGRVFEAPDRTVEASGSSDNAVAAEYWTADNALASLIGWYDTGAVLDTDSVTAAYNVLPSRRLPQLVVEGMNLLEALTAVCKAVGYGFCIEPHHVSDSAAGYAIHCFPLHAAEPTGASPRMPDISAGNVSIASEVGQAAQVQRLDFMHDSHNVRNKATVVGDVQRVQVALDYSPYTCDLAPFWDTATHDLDDYDDGGVIEDLDDDATWIDSYGTDGNDNLTYHHAFRSFIWNEDGAFSGSLALSEPDLSGLIGTDYIRRPRPVGRTHCPTADGTGSVPAYVLMGLYPAGESSVDTSTYIKAPVAAIMADRAGFTINAPRLDKWRPFESFKDLDDGREDYADITFATLLLSTMAGTTAKPRLSLLLVGAIEADIGIEGAAARQAGSAWPLAAEVVAYNPEAFRYHTVASGGDPQNLGTASRDDSGEAEAHAEALRDMGEDSMGHGSLVLRQIVDAWRPGDAIAGTEGRRIPFAINAGGEQLGGGRHYPIIHQVVWNFAEGVNKTELTLDSALLKVNP